MNNTHSSSLDIPLAYQEHMQTSEQIITTSTKTQHATAHIEITHTSTEPEIMSDILPVTNIGAPEPNTVQTQYTALPMYRIVGVINGDTVKLNIDEKVETVRLIDIDTPETVHPSKSVEYFGIEASSKAKNTFRKHGLSRNR